MTIATPMYLEWTVNTIMKHDLLMPANYALVEEDELTYLDGGELSEVQVKLLLGSASVLIASVMLLPDVFAYMLSPILSPITNQVEKITTSITDSIKNIFS